MTLKGVIVSGHGVASGQGNDPRYPEGTLALQLPHFQKQGLNLTSYYPGTINVFLKGKKVVIIQPKYTVLNVNWSSHIPPENFFFFDVAVVFDGKKYQGLIYMPDPKTKTDHYQGASIVELLLPKIPGVKTGKSISLIVEDEQIHFT